MIQCIIWILFNPDFQNWWHKCQKITAIWLTWKQKLFNVATSTCKTHHTVTFKELKMNYSLRITLYASYSFFLKGSLLNFQSYFPQLGDNRVVLCGPAASISITHPMLALCPLKQQSGHSWASFIAVWKDRPPLHPSFKALFKETQRVANLYYCHSNLQEWKSKYTKGTTAKMRILYLNR